MATLATRLPIYQPAMRIISTVTNGNPAAVTTTFDHQYSTGLIVRLNISPGFGMQQANQLYGPIIVTGNTTFTMDIDTLMFDPFITLLNIGSTDGSGNASGTISGNLILPAIGQSFLIGTQVYYVANSSGALSTISTGAGTFGISSKAYTFTGASSNLPIYFNQVPLPMNYQSCTVTPMGEVNETVYFATRNVLPY